jgi:Secretion system C-terminal sorting domain
MKKLLLFVVLCICISAKAQTFITEDCSALTVGNVGTDIGGITAGQGGWYTFVSGGANSDFQVVNTPVNGKSFQITGSAGVTGTRYLSKDLTAQWAGRTSGNDIIEVEYSYFTGAASTSLNTMRLMIWDDSTTPIAIGGIMYTVNTGVVRGLARYDNAGTVGFYSFKLGPVVAGAATDVVLSPNTWYRFGFSFNIADGKIIWKEASTPALFNGYTISAAAGLNPVDFNFLAATGTGNTVAGIGIFDNISVKATATDTLLGIESINDNSSKFSVSPNPTNGLINVTNNDGINVNEIIVTDLNGRVVKSNKFDNVSNIQLDITDLSTGMYMMNIKSDQGTATKKVFRN